jgi:hypothetical protein
MPEELSNRRVIDWCIAAKLSRIAKEPIELGVTESVANLQSSASGSGENKDRIDFIFTLQGT